MKRLTVLLALCLAGAAFAQDRFPVPAATPRAVVQRLGDSILRAMAAPEVLERINAIGQTAAPTGSEDFARLMREDYARWQRVVRAAGVKAE